jgi:hypothetical protein
MYLFLATIGVALGDPFVFVGLIPGYDVWFTIFIALTSPQYLGEWLQILQSLR